MTGRALRLIALPLLLVAGGCSRGDTLATPSAGDGVSPTASPVAPAADPEGVILWLNDGLRRGPPMLTAAPPGEGEGAPVDLSFPPRAVDWNWSPDLTRLLWVDQPRSGVPGARVLIGAADGSSPTVVGELRHWDDFRGRAWSGDSARVAYATYTDHGSTLWVADVSGGEATAIRTWAEPIPVDVDWSPDGTRLAVAVAVGAEAGIVTMAPDGSDERRISNLPEAWRIRWSPVAPVLAVEAGRPGESPGIWRLAADGSEEVRLSPPDVVEIGPVWSPDGGWIAFASERDADPELVDDEQRSQPLIDTGVYVMRPDGSDVRRVVAPPERGWAETWDWFAEWPPDLAG